MKLFGSTESKMTKDKNRENVPYLKITEIILMHRNIVATIISKIQESCIHLFLINHLVNYQIFHPKKLYFKKLLINNFHILKYGLLIKILN